MKRAIVYVSGSLFTLVASQPGKVIEVVSNDIPPDAELIAVSYDYFTDQFFVTLQSASLPDVPPWQQLPRLAGPVLRVSDDSDLPRPEILEKPS